MLDSVYLPTLPSCYDALAWSSDGELAVATSDQIHVLTPNLETAASSSQAKEPWNITRFRVCSFVFAEWDAVPPQNRDNFSLGAEQAHITVLGIAWSPPGLAKFRRSVLAVLTSNLILSLWEPMGLKRQWTRVGIINHALHPDPSKPDQQTGQGFQKVNIRSFQWCSPLKVPSGSKVSSTHGAECRWGIHLLTVATDANEIVLLRVKNSARVDAMPKSYSVEKLAQYALEPQGGHFPMIQPGSLLQHRLQSQARILSLACGPWLSLPSEGKDGSIPFAVATVAMVYGTRLHFVRICMGLSRSNANGDEAGEYEVRGGIEEHTVMNYSRQWARHLFKTSLKWIYTEKSKNVALAAEINGGILICAIERSAYNGKAVKDTQVHTRALHLPEPSAGMEELTKRHWDPITAMIVSQDEQSDTCSLHLGTAGGVGAAFSLDGLENNVEWQVPSWTKHVEERREQYDLNSDLGGSSVARIWGMASWCGVTAILVTNHPTDMIEYQLSLDEQSTIVFHADDTEDWNAASMHKLFAQQAGRRQFYPVQQHRESVTKYLLSRDQMDDQDEDEHRLVYAAACCAIVDGHQESIRSQAQQSLRRLATLTGASLSDEIDKCKTEASSIPAKSTDQLNGPGGQIFEKCEICDAGIGWFAATEAQCVNGHLFARCGVTFLAIQEPGVSKCCSLCRTEYLDEDVLAHKRGGQLSAVFRKLFETFDTCLYCGGKFQFHG